MRGIYYNAIYFSHLIMFRCAWYYPCNVQEEGLPFCSRQKLRALQ